MELPPSLREYVAYVYDLADSSPAHDPRQYNTLFHCAYYLLCRLHRHPAVSLIYYTLDSGTLGVADEDLGDADPRPASSTRLSATAGATSRPPSPRPAGGRRFLPQG